MKATDSALDKHRAKIIDHSWLSAVDMAAMVVQMQLHNSKLDEVKGARKPPSAVPQTLKLSSSLTMSSAVELGSLLKIV